MDDAPRQRVFYELYVTGQRTGVQVDVVRGERGEFGPTEAGESGEQNQGAVLGIIGTGFAYVLNYQIITSEGATVASTVTYLLPSGPDGEGQARGQAR